ncbi:MAG: AMP-binding protein, partial [Anaerolineae bacterium]
LFIFTSGSTASPKIAALTLGNLIYSALGSLPLLNLTPGDSWLLTLPLYHVGGLGILLRCFLSGAEVLISKNSLPETLQLYPVSHLSFIPTHLYRLMREPHLYIDPLIKKAKCILLGGAPISPHLYQKACLKGWKIFTTYGMSEMSSQVTMKTAQSGELDFGVPLKFRELSFASDQEILVRGKTLFQGYWSKETGILLPLSSEGWFQTKDLGGLTAGGQLIFSGRKDHLFISGGENIQPEEIESALYQIPEVAEALVVPIADEEFGARPVAFLTLEKAISLEAIREALQSLLPRYKIPIHFFPFPQTKNETKIKRGEWAKKAEALLKYPRASQE